MIIRRADIVAAFRTTASCAAVLGMLALGACSSERETTLTEKPPATVEAVRPQATANVPPPTAPTQPPPIHAELVPPPPSGGGAVVWHPGHWHYTGKTGSPWTWHNGRYVSPPPGETTWVPGRWAHRTNGSWVWLRGHWA